MHEETDDGRLSAKEQAEAELLEQIGVLMPGMLAIHGQVGLAQCHAMFSMVLDGYNAVIHSEPQLATLLERLVKDGTLVSSNGTYSLPT